MKKPPHFLRSLASRNYRLYINGLWVSQLGNTMTVVAIPWTSYHLSGSPFTVGLVIFANEIPIFILTTFAGVFIDRSDGLKIARVTQTLEMLCSGALAVATFTGHMTIPVLITLCVIQGIINAVDFPARQTLVYVLADDRSMVDNFIALSSLIGNLTRFVFPAIAGLVIAGFGAGACFAIDAVCYLPMLAALTRVRTGPRRPPAPMRPPAHPLADLRDGFRYALVHPSLRRALIMLSVLGLAGFAHTILAPVFARTVLLGDARTLGFLMSATGAGSLMATGFLSSRKSSSGLGRLVAWGAVSVGAGLAGIGASPDLPLAIVSYAAAGFGGSLLLVAGNTWMQLAVEDDKRGRVMSLYFMSQGVYPLGSLLVGILAEDLGPRWAVLTCGVVCLAAGLVFGRTLEKPELAAASP